MTVQEALKGLQAALRGLRPDQGPIARRNARTAFSDRMRCLKEAVDVAYPAPPRRPSQYSLRDNQQAHAARARRFMQEWVPVRPEDELRARADFEKMGIRTFYARDLPVLRGTSWGAQHRLLIPRWAATLRQADLTLQEIKACQRNIAQRKRCLSAAYLKLGLSPEGNS